MKISTENFVTEYEYKGQQWFGISTKLTEQEKKKANYIHTIKFYNSGCNPVATWQTGGNGIIKVDKILPDTVDKTKIIKVADEKVPEKIIQLAVKNNAASITEYEYLGQTLYFLNERENIFHPITPKPIREPYYDKKGREIICFKRAATQAFSREQGWEPCTVQPEKLIKKGVIWIAP